MAAVMRASLSQAGRASSPGHLRLESYQLIEVDAFAFMEAEGSWVPERAVEGLCVVCG